MTAIKPITISLNSNLTTKILVLLGGLLLIFYSTNSHSQTISPLRRVFTYDTTKTLFPSLRGEKTWKPLIGFDAYRSFYSGEPVKFNGIRAGVEFRGVHRFGFGFYGLKKDLYFTDVIVNDPVATDTSLVKFKLNYAALFYERVFFSTPKWEISFPLYLGGGGLEAFVEGSDGLFHRYFAKSFSLLNTGFHVKHYLLPWLAPRVGAGYRFAFNTSKQIRSAFNGLYYSFGLSILVGELWESIFHESLKDRVKKETKRLKN